MYRDGVQPRGFSDQPFVKRFIPGKLKPAVNLLGDVAVSAGWLGFFVLPTRVRSTLDKNSSHWPNRSVCGWYERGPEHRRYDEPGPVTQAIYELSNIGGISAASAIFAENPKLMLVPLVTNVLSGAVETARHVADKLVV